jgi:hypothetical protein
MQSTLEEFSKAKGLSRLAQITTMRDDFLCVIEWQSHCIRARVGVGEVIALPSIVRQPVVHLETSS